MPPGRLIGWRPFVRFVLNQDTGGAIRGFQRADLYMGSGDDAGAHAGYMNSPGKIYFLMLKNQSRCCRRGALSHYDLSSDEA